MTASADPLPRLDDVWRRDDAERLVPLDVSVSRYRLQRNENRSPALTPSVKSRTTTSPSTVYVPEVEEVSASLACSKATRPWSNLRVSWPQFWSFTSPPSMSNGESASSSRLTLARYVPSMAAGASSTRVHGWDPHTTSNGTPGATTSENVSWSPSSDQAALISSSKDTTSIRSRKTVYVPLMPTSGDWPSTGGCNTFTTSASKTMVNTPVASLAASASERPAAIQSSR